MKSMLKTIIETNQSIPYLKEVLFLSSPLQSSEKYLKLHVKKFDHHIGSLWKSDLSPRVFHPYLGFFFLCGLWLSHHLSFLFPPDLKGMQNNTDPRKRFGLNLILSNREFKQLKRVTESIWSKNMGISEKNSVRIQAGKAAVLSSSPSPFYCCYCPPLSHFPPFWKLLSILFFWVPLLLQLALSLAGCCSFAMLASSTASTTRLA